MRCTKESGETMLNLAHVKRAILISIAFLMIISSVSANQVLEKENYELIDSVALPSGQYQIIKTSGPMPGFDVIEVCSVDTGIVPTDEDLIDEVFLQSSWKYACKDLQPQDIERLNALGADAESIRSVITPTVAATNALFQKFDALRKEMGIFSIGLDVVLALTDISVVEKDLRSFNDNLTAWRDASDDLSTNLPNAVKGLEKAKLGNYSSIYEIQSVRTSNNAIKVLNEKTAVITDTASGIINRLTDIENGFRNSAKTVPLVSSLLNQTADAVHTLVEYCVGIREDSDTFSQDSHTSSVYLSQVIQNADDRYNELKWQYDLQKFVVPVIVFLILIVIIIILIWVFVIRK